MINKLIQPEETTALKEFLKHTKQNQRELKVKIDKC
jgi:hypothetical protein